MSEQKKKPVAAGKSSLDHIDQNKAFKLFNIQPREQLVDLACGIGRYSLALAAAFPKLRIVALDLWPEGIAALQETLKMQKIVNIQAAVADISQPLPLPAESVDQALLATVLHDLPQEKQAAVIDNLDRVLKPGGSINIIEFKKRSDGPGPGIDKRLDVAALELLLNAKGLKKICDAELGEYTYLARFER